MILKSVANVTTSGEDNTTTTVQQQTQVTSQNAQADMLLSIYEFYNILNEAEDDNTKKQKAVNNDTSGGEDKTQRNNIKKITWYLSGNTDIISAKMKILRQRYLDAINILKIAFPKQKEEKKENEVEVKTNTTQTTQQVNI